jgi:1-acyl-sn-glycerol-3-phosphate acyltransferase
LIVADRINFYDKWWFLPFRSVMVPVDRGDRRKQAVALLKIRKAIERGRIVIIFPEGGRTFKGNPGEFLYSQMGNKIRFLREGVGLLVSKTGASVIPIGIKGSDEVVPNSRRRLWTRFVFWGRIKMCIGQPMTFSPEASRERITQEIAAKLLELVDEAS